MELGHELNVLLLLDIELFEMELITLELIACASVSLQSVRCFTKFNLHERQCNFVVCNGAFDLL